MARYDLPTYVLHVLGHFWMFAVKITEWIFSLKSLGLWTWTWTHLPIVWDKVPNKSVFFVDTFPNDWKMASLNFKAKYIELEREHGLVSVRLAPRPQWNHRRQRCLARRAGCSRSARTARSLSPGS